MIADEIDQEVSLASTLEVSQDLRDRTATILQKLQSMGDGDGFYLEISPPYTFFLLNGDMELHRDWQIFV
jgi:hypothetical protein